MRARVAITCAFGAISFGGLVGVAVLGARNEIADSLEALGFALVFALFGAMGVLLAIRRPENTIGLTFAGAGAAMGVASSARTVAEKFPAGGLAPWAALLGDVMGLLGIGLIPVILLLWPDGRLPSRRWRLVGWITVISGPYAAFGTALTPGRLAEGEGPLNPMGNAAVGDSELLAEGGVGWLLLMVGFIAAGVSLVVRFRGSTGVRRQQLKWLAFSAVLVAVAWLAIVALWEQTDAQGFSVYLLLIPALTTVPLAVTRAILRHRLYDIDVIINRTLVYGLLTGIVTATYVTAVLVLQQVLRPFTATSSFAVAGSTMLVAALFRPARTHVQRFVDRRFYRARYDAALILEQFGERLRTEVDLDELVGELVTVTGATLQPAHISLWLKQQN